MHTLRIHQNGEQTLVPFEGPKKLQEILIENGILPDHPCGGRGTCGKCKVVLEGSVSAPNEAEQKAGHRLSCQAMILADAQVGPEMDYPSVEELRRRAEELAD